MRGERWLRDRVGMRGALVGDCWGIRDNAIVGDG